MALPNWISRTELLLGEDTLAPLFSKHVLVVGLGGVGGICAEMIARAGVGKMTIVDADVVDISNTNRQIPALHSTVGQLKAEVMAARLLDINPQLSLTVLPKYLEHNMAGELLDNNTFDYVADCIDTLSPKIELIKACKQRNIPIATALGAGGKVDPSLVQVVDISKTHQCTLAKYVRKRLHAEGIYNGLPVVFSPEKIDADRVIVSEKAFPKKSLIGTISYMPAIFGCTLASIIIRHLYEGGHSTEGDKTATQAD